MGSGCRLPQHRIWLGWYELVALDALALGWWAGVIDAVAVSSQLLLVVVSGLGALRLPVVVVVVAVAVQSLVLVGAVAGWVSRVLAGWVQMLAVVAALGQCCPAGVVGGGDRLEEGGWCCDGGNVGSLWLTCRSHP